MNDLPNSNGEASTDQRLAALSHQLNSALMLVLAIAVIITWFFGYQFYFHLKDSQRARQAATDTRKRIDTFMQVNDPQFQEIVRRLQDYAKTHPDVLPILNKYGVGPTSSVPAQPKK